MQLIFCAHVELESVEEGDERLVGRDLSSAGKEAKGDDDDDRDAPG